MPNGLKKELINKSKMGVKLEECSLYQVSFGYNSMFVIASSYDKAEQKAILKKMEKDTTKESLLTVDGSLKTGIEVLPTVTSISLISKEIIF